VLFLLPFALGLLLVDRCLRLDLLSLYQIGVLDVDPLGFCREYRNRRRAEELYVFFYDLLFGEDNRWFAPPFYRIPRKILVTIDYFFIDKTVHNLRELLP
jgi:hypothetical protein